MFWLILLITLVIVVLVFGPKAAEKSEKQRQELAALCLDEANVIRVGKYVSGHPDMDNEVDYAVIYKKDDDLIIASRINDIAIPNIKAQIKTHLITDVQAEDESTFERRVSLGRVLIVGVFALAWRKRKKNEMAFVTIEWNDGRFDHSTIFNFNGQAAMQRANTARNKIIKLLT